MRKWISIAAVAVATGVIASPHAQARITRIEIAKIEPAFAGRTFGSVGAYQRLTGKAYGEVDPAAEGNASIQDIARAPRNARGMVEYVTDVDILRPADRSRGNGVLFFNIVNRGNKGGLSLFNADVPANLAANNNVAEAGDGFMQTHGYTIVWFGWQADVAPGGGRMTMKVPVARNDDASPITQVIRSELTTPREIIPASPITTLNLSSGWFTAMTTASYSTVSTDNRTPLADGFLPQLTVRGREHELRVTIPNTEWSFGACNQDGKVSVSDTQICYPAGFKAGHLYELTYRARDPL